VFPDFRKDGGKNMGQKLGGVSYFFRDLGVQKNCKSRGKGGYKGEGLIYKQKGLQRKVRL